MSLKKDDNYYENEADKRTKEYKKWKKLKDAELAKQSKGLGDTVSKITEATGIKALVHKIFGEDCGCGHREDWLNHKIKYSVKKCATEEQYYFLKSFFSKPRPRIQIDTLEKLVEVNNHIFEENKNAREWSTCCSGGKVQKMALRLNLYLNSVESLLDASDEEE